MSQPQSALKRPDQAQRDGQALGPVGAQPSPPCRGLLFLMK